MRACAIRWRGRTGCRSTGIYTGRLAGPMRGTPGGRRLPGPPPESPSEHADLGKSELARHLREGHVGLDQQLACDFEADLVDHRAEGETLSAETAAERPGVHRKQGCNRL